MRQFLIAIALWATLGTSTAHAYDTFYPEADETLQSGKPWVQISFKDTMTRAIFRAWYPYAAEDVWRVLIDTNGWKTLHPSDYADSRALDKNQYDLVVQKKPSSLRDFYELIGQQIYPSEHGREKGGQWMSYVFQRFNLPWPLKDRWLVMKARNDETRADKGEYRYDYKMEAGNFKELKGAWQLLPVPGRPGWTEFRGDYKSDPGIEVPQFLAKTIIRSSLKRTTDEKLEYLEKKGFKKAPTP